MRRLMLVVLAAALSGCGRPPRVKLTAVVVADGVEYTGSVVNEYGCARGSNRIFGDASSCTVRGDAGVIPLGPKGYAFLTLSYPRIAADIMPDAIAYGDADNASSLAWDIPLDQAPILVHFRDINDPTSVEQIDPLHPEKTPGLVFKSLSGELTEEPVTMGAISHYFPWWEKAKVWGDLSGTTSTFIAGKSWLSRHLDVTSFERN